MEKIKRCPFCGAVPKIDGSLDTIKVSCKCGAIMKGEAVSLCGYKDALSLTLEKWNNRTSKQTQKNGSN